MTILESVTSPSSFSTRRRHSDILPYRCTTHATVALLGRAVCVSHARALRIRWFDHDE
jgi:hypothetical protein